VIQNTREEKITLVLLPGMDGTGLLFSDFVVALDSRFKVEVVSYPNEEVLGYSELTELARAALPKDRPFVILGESFSGPIAIALAAQNSEMLRGLVLCCSFARSPHPALSALRALLPAISTRLAPYGALSHFVLGKYSTSGLRRALVDAIERVSPLVLRARLRAVLMIDVRENLATIRVPVLYLGASQDRVVPKKAWTTVARECPQARRLEIQGPHFLLQTNPKDCAKAVSEFVGGLNSV
jgi:pimeloyl-ACP methyl ester carboxylesterase